MDVLNPSLVPGGSAAATLQVSAPIPTAAPATKRFARIPLSSPDATALTRRPRCAQSSADGPHPCDRSLGIRHTSATASRATAASLLDGRAERDLGVLDLGQRGLEGSDDLGE